LTTLKTISTVFQKFWFRLHFTSSQIFGPDVGRQQSPPTGSSNFGQTREKSSATHSRLILVEVSTNTDYCIKILHSNFCNSTRYITSTKFNHITFKKFKENKMCNIDFRVSEIDKKAFKFQAKI